MSRLAREILEAVMLALIVLVLVQGTVRNFKVEGSSMHPTLEGGQYLVVDQVSYFKLDMERLARILPFWQAQEGQSKFAFDPPNRGEVIVFRYPEDPTKDFVKRVVGVPGETVEVRSGTVFVDGVALSEPYLERADRSDARQIILGPKEYYVIGDNRSNSNDSRAWGVVPEDNIVGRVLLVYWPWEDVHFVDSR